MTIKQQGGIFGRNPTFNNVEVEGSLTVNGEAISDFGTMAQQDADSVNIDGGTIDGTTVGITTPAAIKATTVTTSGTLLVNRSTLLTGAVIEASYAGAGTQYGIELQPAADNTYPLMFKSSGGSVIGSIYATSSNISIDVGNGGGIDFSATSGTGTSELFDDYEEGSLSSLDVQDSSGNSASTSTKRGLYRKIGNMVFVSAEIYNVNTSGLTSGDQLRVYGLPYVSASAGHTNYGAVQLNDFTLSGSAGTFVQNVQGADYVRLQMNTLAAGGADSVIVSDAASGTADIFFSIAYPTD